MNSIGSGEIDKMSGTLDSIGLFPSIEITQNTIKTVPFGVYRLEAPPPLDFWENIINYGEGEVGLIGFRNRWIISTNRGSRVDYPDIIRVLHNKRLFDADIHSHPYLSWYAQFPSLDVDLPYLDSTANREAYIFSPFGLSMFRVPEKFPDEHPTLKDVQFWLSAWRREEFKKVKEERPDLSLREYDEIHNHELFKRFFENKFSLRIIPWEDKEKMEKEYQKLTTDRNSGKLIT